MIGVLLFHPGSVSTGAMPYEGIPDVQNE